MRQCLLGTDVYSLEDRIRTKPRPSSTQFICSLRVHPFLALETLRTKAKRPTRRQRVVPKLFLPCGKPYGNVMRRGSITSLRAGPPPGAGPGGPDDSRPVGRPGGAAARLRRPSRASLLHLPRPAAGLTPVHGVRTAGSVPPTPSPSRSPWRHPSTEGSGLQHIPRSGYSG